MTSETFPFVGAAWLLDRYRLSLAAPLISRSVIAARRKTRKDGDALLESYPKAMRPADTLIAHLAFHLKHEPPHFELLARLFALCDPKELADWITTEPTGQYARRAGFLYEFFTGQSLPIETGRAGGNYVDAFPNDFLVMASPSCAVPNPRWRVRDNLPGTRFFCPMVRKTGDVVKALAVDIPALLAALEAEFGEDILMRSAIWLTTHESKSSFAIEGEGTARARIARFAAVMEHQTGVGEAPPLDAGALAALQAGILGESRDVPRFGLRQSPVFIGGSALVGEERVYYIAPLAEDVAPMLEGITIFLRRTIGQSPILRSAVVAFGFVYAHPLADGNGRVHRFLFNDILRRDGAVAPPMIVPLSGLISGSAKERAAYDRILDTVSRPLMRQLAGQYDFSPRANVTVYPDGIISNFNFRGAEIARPVWRYPELTAHTIWLSQTLVVTIEQDMRKDSAQLRLLLRLRAALKDIIELPDQSSDRLIRSFLDNEGQLSNALMKEFPILSEQTWIWSQIQQVFSAIQQSLMKLLPDAKQ